MKINVTIEIKDEELKKLFDGIIDAKKGDMELDNPEASFYARFFDESCPAWSKDPEYNLVYLITQEKYANDKLRSQRYLFLNDVYDMLGIPRTKSGQTVGWIYDEENPVGDNHISFCIYSERNRDFVNGYESTCLLDFNVDGEILSKI